MKPIRSKRDLIEAETSLRELRHQLAMLGKAYRHDKEALAEATRGLRQLVRETRHAIAVYEQAQVGSLPAVMGARNPQTGTLEVPRLLRVLRLGAQLGQGDLAERLGTRQGNISRWEREGYDGYSLRQLARIADALGYDLDVSFTHLLVLRPTPTAGSERIHFRCSIRDSVGEWVQASGFPFNRDSPGNFWLCLYVLA